MGDVPVWVLDTNVLVSGLLSPSAPPGRLVDVIFLEVALQTPERTIVTGNLKHFPPGCRGPVIVMSPRAAWEYFVGLGLT